MIIGKEKLIPIFALLILIISGTASAYVYVTQVDKDTIEINGNSYTVEQLFYIGESKTIQTVEGEKTGVSLEDLISKVGIGCPSCNEYTIKGSGNYEKTVDWGTLKTGIFSDIKKVYFPDTPKNLWVGDIYEIEVK